MALEDQLRREMTGEVLFDRFSRGRYATDASFYQIKPAGVMVPKRRGGIAGNGHRPRPGRRDAARRRHLAMRPDDQ